MRRKEPEITPCSYDATTRSARLRHQLGVTMFWILLTIVWVIAVGVGAWLIFHSYPDPDRIDVKRYALPRPGPVDGRRCECHLGAGHGVLQLCAGQYRSRGRRAHVRPHLGPDRAGHLADRALADLRLRQRAGAEADVRQSQGVLAGDPERLHHHDDQLLRRTPGCPRPDRPGRHRLVRPARAEQPQPGVQGRGGQVRRRRDRAQPRGHPQRRAQGAARRGSRPTRSASTT